MYNFRYLEANSIAETKEALRQNGKILAGGQTLIPTLKQRLASHDVIVDIKKIDGLREVEVNDNFIVYGSMIKHFEIENCQNTKKALSAISYLASMIGDPQVRNIGTIGGSIANNDPAADWPSAVLALRGKITTDKRVINSQDFFSGLFETALDEDEVIIKISLEVPQVANYQKFAQPASRFALVGVFLAKYSDTEVYVAVTGAGSDGVYLEENLQNALSSNFSPAAIEKVEIDNSNLITDIHAGSEYRGHLIKVLTKRAVENCLQNC